VTVQVSVAPDAGSGGGLTVCNTSPPIDLFLQLGGAPDAGGTWTDPNGLAHGSLFDPAVDPAGTYSYTVGGTSPCADAQATITIAVDPEPDAGTGGPLTVCSSDAPIALTTALGGTPQPGGGWSDPNGQPFGGTFTPGLSLDGNYTYTVGTGPPCGTASATVTMTTQLAPDAGTDGTLTICAVGGLTDLFVLLGASAQPGGTWTDPNGSMFSGTYDPAIDGPGAYTYLLQGGATCPDASATVQVTEVNQPNAGTDVVVSLCDDVPTTDLFLLLGGTPDAGGSWTDPLGQPSTGSIAPGTATAGTYTYTVSAPPPCTSASADVDLTLVPAPPTGQTAAVSLCTSASPVDLLPLLVGLPSTGNWTDPNGAPMNGTLDPSLATAGTYTFTLQATAPCMDGTHTVAVTLQSPPNAGAPGALTVCAVGAPTALLSALGGSPDPGGTWTDPNGLAQGPDYDPITDAPGIYLYIAAGAGPCIADSATVIVTEVSPPDAGTDASIAVCEGDAPFDPYAFLGGTPAAGGTWTGPGGVVVLPPVDPASAAVGAYTYTVNGTAPCPVANATLSLFIDPSPLAGSDGSLTLCSFQTPVDLMTIIGPQGQPGGQWTDPNGIPTASIVDPAFSTTGGYHYIVEGQGACAGRSDTAVVQVSIASQPDLLLSVVPASGCAPLEVMLIPQYGAAVVDLTWQLGDGAVVAQNGPLEHTYVAPGVYGPFVQYTDTAGCAWETPATALVSALAPPNVGVQVRRAVIPLDDAVVEAWPVGDVCTDHLWKVNGTPVDTTVELRYRFDPPMAGHHLICVLATDSLGCSAEACSIVLVDDVLIVHVPNTFTPNGDGFNDTFEPVLVGADTEDFGFWIFDRWGEVVFSAEEPGHSWNGTMNGSGQLLQDGVYGWRLIVRDAFSADRRELFGHVTLIK
jgi:gliding motility-associated-like protein